MHAYLRTRRIEMRSLQFLVCALAILASACTPVAQVNRPIVIGLPGVTYHSTEAAISVEVVNNGKRSGDILVGETVVYKNVVPRDIKNVGFDCDGVITLESRRLMGRSIGSRPEYVNFRPDDGSKIQTRSVQVNCESTAKSGRAKKSRFVLK